MKEDKGLKSRGWWLMVVVITLKVAECGQPVLHRIGGGRNTWAPHTNFTQWSSQERFYVGDWLYFGFDKRIYNVLEVNSTSYENCIDKDFIYNVTRGGRDVFNLTVAKTYFFLSGRGYCFEGMKVAIHVQEIPPEQLLPNSSNGSQSYVYSHITLLAMLAVAASAWTFPY
ncbi:lamin-like protein [Pyrus ussuriensis x Pyrus communis]|uniref:Lamin-like protein n=1 Tax=Pyrus ussuriensis x Pyrus communis TaxID=2448454 RepID=A0A5N5FT84_9ROSA|nr:lamin-like protein [Pyrus ussuriensis x Pyrus communis]